MMRVLLVGALGSIGRRYANILHNTKGIDIVALDPAFDTKHRNADWFKERDIKTLGPKNGKDYEWPKRDQYKCDKALIACPTEHHDDWCRKAIENSTPFLCEKPLSKNFDSCVSLARVAAAKGVPGHVVCNYKFSLTGTTRSFYEPITYNYYHLSNAAEEPEWSCCQLLYLNPGLTIKTDSTVWTLEIEHRRRTQNLPYRKVEIGYIEMVEDWLAGGENCWTLEDGVKMTKIALARIKKGERNGKAGKKRW